MSKYSEWKKRYLLWVVVMLTAILVVVLTLFLRNKINTALYRERKESLAQLTATAARSINDNVDCQWEIERVLQTSLTVDCQSSSCLQDRLARMKELLAAEGDFIFVVDSTGKYYCTDGGSGRITDTDYFLSTTAEELEYLGTLPHFKTELTYLVLRSRLSEPMTVTNGDTEVSIAYFCLMHDVTALNAHIGTLFDGQNNLMIYDTDNGLMLYKHFGIRLLVPGYNVFDKYRKIDLLYGADGNEIVQKVKNGESDISLMQVGNETYYLCTTSLDVANWALMLVVDSAFFTAASRNTFGGVILSVAAVLGVCALLAVFLFWYFERLKLNSERLEDEKRTSEALRDAYQVKSNFLSYMSHDIRTPINGMIGMANIGLLSSGDKGRVEDCFRKISASSKHLLAIVNDVLDMSAVESGKIVITNEKMNLTGTLNDCVDVIRGTLNNRVLHLETDYDCPRPLVLGDEFHLKQIIINFLSNAVKFTEDGGTIRVGCKQLEEEEDVIRYRISVSDTGCGMEEEFQKHIFEAFRTAKPDGKAKFKGSGLGMAISYEYVKLMGGTIQVESQLNVGSTFTIVMPFGKTEQEQKALDPKEMNVLLVDDNEMNLEIAQAMLEDEVKSVTVAHDGKEALDLFASGPENQFDLILMDVMMPVMNGLEATKAIRALPRGDSGIYILALTANVYKDDIDAIFASGMDGYLNKPFDVNQLLDKIKKGR